MRNTFIKDLVLHARNNEKIILIVGDLGYSVVEPFAEEFPERFFNSGVAEQNMTGMAAGIASEGYHVFTYSIANFPIFRCAEQIRNDIDYHNLPVTIVSVGGGLAYGNLGYSHHGVQDFSLIRSMPNMLIAAPGDPLETSACMNYLIENPQPSFLRINKAGEPNIHARKPIILDGQIQILANINKSNNIILTTGSILNHIYKIYNSNKIIQENFAIASLPLWGEKVREKIIEQLKPFKHIIIIEEHLISGGFASFIQESGVVVKSLNVDIKACGEVGHQDFLINKYGLSQDELLKVIKKIIKN
ncbi:transketolase [Gammaproteobacteria bacterium]|nr:transketolase [Gammaproteobacteria bacterium]